MSKTAGASCKAIPPKSRGVILQDRPAWLLPGGYRFLAVLAGNSQPPRSARCEVLLDAAAPVVAFTKGLFRGLQLLAGTGIEAAVLDVRLQIGTTHTLAFVLKSRKIPFLSQTGFADEARQLHPDLPVLEKPSSASELVPALPALLH